MPGYRRKNEPELLKDILESYTVPPLQKLAALVGTERPTRKAELVNLLHRELHDAGHLKAIWDKLDSLQQAAVAEIVYSRGLEFDLFAFRAKYGKDPDWGASSRYGEMEKPSLLRLLIYAGTMPRDLKEMLKVFVPPPHAVKINTVDEPPTTISQTERLFDYNTRQAETQVISYPVDRVETERAAQHDLLAVLRLIDLGKIRASDKTNRVTAAGAKAITAVLQGGDFYPPDESPIHYDKEIGPIKAFAWPLLLQSAGLAELAGTKLQLTAAGKKALTAPPHQTMRTIWQRWLKTKLLDEFNRIDAIKGQSGKGQRSMTAVAGRRQVIEQALAECPVGGWLTFDEFSRFMRATNRTFEVSRDLWTLYLVDANYGSLGYEGFGEWPIVQGRYLLAFLFEYAATLGLIDVAYIHPAEARPDYRRLWGADDYDCLSRYDGLLYFRLNNLGAWCLGLTPQYQPAAVEVRSIFKVLPNYDVIATEAPPPGDVLLLERFAESTADVVWKIQPARLLAAVEEGQSIAEIETFLQAKSANTVPDTVLILLKETAARVSQLQDRGPARLIEAQDAALAQLIANDSRLRSLCMVAGERHLVIPADSEAAFRRALRELGYAWPPGGSSNK